MGMYASAQLVFGYDLGGLRGNYTEPRVRGDLPDWVSSDEGLEEAAQTILLRELGGFDREYVWYNDPKYPEYMKERREALESYSNVGISYYGFQYDSVALTVGNVYWGADLGECGCIDMSSLDVPVQWVYDLERAVQALNIRPVQDHPSWLLLASYG